MPTFNTVIKSHCDENGKWQFKAQDPLGITVDCILSNWDKYDEFIAENNDDIKIYALVRDIDKLKKTLEL